MRSWSLSSAGTITSTLRFAAMLTVIFVPPPQPKKKSWNTENSHWQGAPPQMNEWAHGGGTSRNVTLPVLSQNTADKNQSASEENSSDSRFVQTLEKKFFLNTCIKLKHTYDNLVTFANFYPPPEEKYFRRAKSTHFLPSPLSGFGCRLRKSKGEEQTVGKHRGLPWCKTLKSRPFIYLFIYFYLLHATQKKAHINTSSECVAWT